MDYDALLDYRSTEVKHLGSNLAIIEVYKT